MKLLKRQTILPRGSLYFARWQTLAAGSAEARDGQGQTSRKATSRAQLSASGVALLDIRNLRQTFEARPIIAGPRDPLRHLARHPRQPERV